MSVCSATAAASSRPGARRESRGSAARASTSEPQFFIDRGGIRMTDPRKYSTASTNRSSSSSNWCCVISIVMILIVTWFHPGVDFIG